MLEGYSEKLFDGSYQEHSGSIFIKDKGRWQSAPYLLWNEAGYSGKALLTIGDTWGDCTTFEKL
jgi:hypothetical protein